MDPQHLKAFVTISETGSFSTAAEQLHLTQPAVSKRILLLEQALNNPLFDRLGKQVLLTQAGLTLLPHARHILQSVTNAIQAMGDLQGRLTGELSIVTSHHIGLHRLKNILHAYSEANPAVKLNLYFLDSESACEEILQGRFDLGIITLAPEIDPRLNSQTLWHDQLQFAVSPTHPLVAFKKPKLADLSQHQAILPDRNSYTTRLVQQRFDAAEQPLNVSMTTNHLDTMKMMVSIGLGWTLLPKILMDKQLAQLPIEIPPLTRKLGVISHKKKSASKAAVYFLELLKNETLI